VSLSAWLTVLVSLGLMRRARFGSLVALVAPFAFAAVFFASLSLRRIEPGSRRSKPGSLAPPAR
jgi:hypothetical protein